MVVPFLGQSHMGMILKLNRKVKDLAKIGALSSKAKENKIVVVEDGSLQMEAPSTKTVYTDFQQY